MVRIAENGRVVDVEISESSGFTTLDRAAERAVRRTRFAPATRNNQPVPGVLTIAIHFRLDS
jgi:protein TonB